MSIKIKEANMRQMIDGKMYDVDAASYIAGGDNSEWGNAWWGLYRTHYGEYFNVVIDHDGSTVKEFRPVTDAEANELLEKYSYGFAAPQPDGGIIEGQITIRVPKSLIDRLEAAADAKSLSLNSYARRCLERCIASDGHPVV